MVIELRRDKKKEHNSIQEMEILKKIHKDPYKKR
jgi:hypothetical protein